MPFSPHPLLRSTTRIRTRCISSPLLRSKLSELHAKPSITPKALQGRVRTAWIAGSLGLATAFALWLYTEQSNKPILHQLSPTYFIPASLLSSEDVSKNSKLLKLRLPPNAVESGTRLQPIWSIYVKDSDIQVERPYTPLEGISNTAEMSFWVKKYPHGEVGRWLNSRIPAAEIEVRGPVVTWDWQDERWDNVIMISGGTGITPFYQLLHSNFSSSNPRTRNTRFTLLQSYRSPSELPPSFMLENLCSWSRASGGQLEVRTFVDDLEGSSNKRGLVVGRISKGALEAVLKSRPHTPGRTIVLVCGPDIMINALAGPKDRDLTQGLVGGVLGELSDGSFDVWKL